MAAQVPAKVKEAGLGPFVIRAAQLELAKPVVAYWCEYWIVNQIIARGLHNGDQETMQYTMGLMDKLEQIKADNPTNDAIMDDLAGQAYVEQFGLETFQRADRAVQANKVTKQTADTFQAAATFLDLVNIWNPPDTETLAKIKYAKWNAIRIVRALKEGNDPNESNPKQAPEPEEQLPALDPNDPEVQDVLGATKSRQPSVVEVPDEDLVGPSNARQSILDQSLHPSAQVSARGSPAPFDPYPRNGFPYTAATQDDNVSPMEPSPPTDRNGSVGGGYFPEVPTFTSESQPSSHPTAPPDDMPDLGLPQQPSFAPGSRSPDFNSQPSPGPDPQDYYHQGPPSHHSNAPPQQPHYTSQPKQSPPHQFAPPPQQPTPPPQHYAPPPSQQQPYQPSPQQYSHLPASNSAPPQAPAPSKGPPFNTDDVAIAKAQKHARWAISALNFEDAETAVRELREALKTLGAL